MSNLKEISERSTAAFNAHDAEAVAAQVDPSVVFTAPGPSGRTEFRGREAVKQYNQNWFTAFPNAKTAIISEVITGEYIVVEGTFEGTNTGSWKSAQDDMPATGKTLKGQYCQVSRVKDGWIASSNLYFDQLEVMTQLGLLPAPAEARA